MEPETERNEKKSSKNPLVPVLLIVLIAAVVALIAVIAVRPSTVADAPENETAETPEEETGKKRVGYAEGTVAVDSDSLQAAVDEMNRQAAEGGVRLQYKNDAISHDGGTTFSCYIANAETNKYDMFIDIYSDAALTDEVFLSELMRPGTAFEEITLSHPLEEGENLVYVAFTQVEDVDGEQTIHAQVVATMNFIVRE